MNMWSTAVVRVVLTAVTVSMMTAAQASAQASAPALCGALPFCYETLSFATRISDFQALLQNGNTKTLTVRLSFRNKLSRPLMLGYVANSGVATDDHGNKYLANGDRAVQGIGVIQGIAGDQKFVLQPGEASDARFEFVWNASPQEIFGLSFQIDLAIREIDPIPGNQVRLGREHALHFSGLGNRPAAAAAAPRMTTVPSSGLSGGTPASTAPAPAQVDPCVGSTRCYNAGPFAAEVAGLTASYSGNGNAVHVIKANVRFKNLTSQPVVLGYLVDSAVVTDNYGNRYQVQGNQRGDGPSGIGTVTRTESDPQFVLAPGASGNATFTLSRYKRDTPIGSTFALDLTIAQLEVLPSRQVRTIREHSVGFTQLSGSAATAAAPVSEPPGGLPSQTEGCGGKPRCFSADPFVAEVAGLTSSFSGNGNAVHVLKASVRFRNTTNRPVVLGYIADSAVVTDNIGNRYEVQVNNRGDGAAGIGTVTRAIANPQFVLAPGASRDATFTVSRYKRDSRIGSTFAFDLTIAHLDVLPGEQVRVLREYAVGFTALTAGGGSFLDRLLQLPPK